MEFDSVLDQWPLWDTLIVFGDINSMNGTNGSDIRNTINSLLIFARFKGYRIASQWYQRQELHSVT